MRHKLYIMEKLHGIIVPMVTPLKPDGTLDFESTEKLVEHLISGGVHGIFALGTTGESQGLSAQQRVEFVKFVGSKIAGRIPYLVGVSDTSLADSVKLAEVAQTAGACGVVATPPYYYAPSQDDMVKWFTALADAGLTKTITADNGLQFARHETVTEELGIKFYFAKPYHSWERGSNENLNGLIRQYIPKWTDFNTLTREDILTIQEKINNRPRKRLAFSTPNDIFVKLTRLDPNSCV